MYGGGVRGSSNKEFGVISHAISLAQPNQEARRQDLGYGSVNECMEGLCKMYEEHVKRKNPNSSSITYK